jgi:hypothetical protein
LLNSVSLRDLEYAIAVAHRVVALGDGRKTRRKVSA